MRSHASDGTAAVRATPAADRTCRAAAAAVIALGCLAAVACSGPTSSSVPTPALRPTASAGLVPTGPEQDSFLDRHPNGATLEVRGVEVRPHSLALQVVVVNGNLEPIRLTDKGFMRNRWLWAVDDLGNAYRFDGRANVTIGPGEALAGTLVFLGEVPSDARSVSVKTNVDDPAAAVDFNDRARDAVTPTFFIEGIPLPPLQVSR